MNFPSEPSIAACGPNKDFSGHCANWESNKCRNDKIPSDTTCIRNIVLREMAVKRTDEQNWENDDE